MASHSYPSTLQSDHVRAAVAEVKTLTVDKLKRALRSENLTVSGVKSELQVRLIGFIERCAANGDFATVDRMRASLKCILTSPSNPYPSPYSSLTPSSPLSPTFVQSGSRIHQGLPPLQQMSSFSSSRLVFKESPFYSIKKPLSAVTELKAREQTRDTARLQLRFGAMDVDQLQRDPNTRVMVFCAAENSMYPNGPHDIAFPQHGELKCNADEVKHNLKGMKGKPGTTRPADITQFVRKTCSFPNSVELVYALTNKKFFLVANLVQKHPTSDLVSGIKHRRTPFSKDRVIREMQSKADDPDIVATSTNMSLKDPLQMTRIQTPCRGVACTHNGCFDAAVYLALQEQAPQWSCPICQKPVPWDQVAYDQYFAEILQNVDEDTEQVTVEPDGRWYRGDTTVTDQTGTDRSVTKREDDSDDDDIVEITDHSMSRSRGFHSSPIAVRPPLIPSMSTTPVPNSASSNIPPTFSGSELPPIRSNKRPHSETIDLTLDDSDDDQPPISRIKRPALASQPSDPYRYRSQENDTFRFHMPPAPSDLFDPSRFPGF